jgi:hypothetical protein
MMAVSLETQTTLRRIQAMLDGIGDPDPAMLTPLQRGHYVDQCRRLSTLHRAMAALVEEDSYQYRDTRRVQQKRNAVLECERLVRETLPYVPTTAAAGGSSGVAAAVRRAAEIYELRHKEPGDGTAFEATLRRAERHVIDQLRTGRPAHELRNLVNNLSVARDMGADECPDPLLRSIDGAGRPWAGRTMERHVARVRLAVR